MTPNKLCEVFYNNFAHFIAAVFRWAGDCAAGDVGEGAGHAARQTQGGGCPVLKVRKKIKSLFTVTLK